MGKKKVKKTKKQEAGICVDGLVVKVGPMCYAVKETKHIISDDGSLTLAGNIEYRRCRINIQKGDADDYKLWTVMHEIAHALDIQVGLELGTEKKIDALGLALLQLIQDNPALVELIERVFVGKMSLIQFVDPQNDKVAPGTQRDIFDETITSLRRSGKTS